MNKEILEITKKFHDTYEKLASEYTYETREDTKVFDINSNNGKLMYATVNEIVSPILEENQKLNGTIQTYDILLKSNIEENKQLQERMEYLERSNNRREDIIIEQRQEISDLEDNWDELKEIIKKKFVAQGGFTSYEWNDLLNELLDKMQEMEKKV